MIGNITMEASDFKTIKNILRKKYRVENGKHFSLADYDPADIGGLSLDKKQGKKLLEKRIQTLNNLQELLYANGKCGLMVVLQGLDTAGKDGTIKHVTSGLNPQGIHVASFRQPGPVELEHDYLWRIHVAVPARGHIGIFNRSHYEEVLVTKVHSSILNNQKLPQWALNDVDFWQHRYEDIVNFEKYIHHQGIAIVKFFLNISKEEQRIRLLARLDNKEKQWKFSPNDPKERQFWEQYQAAYQTAIAQTSFPHAPWIIVPANNKWYAHLVVIECLINALENLNLTVPKPKPEITDSIEQLKAELGEDTSK